MVAAFKLLPPPKDKIYFGAFPGFGGSEDQVSRQKIVDFETLVQKKSAWVYFSQNWYNGIVYPKEAIEMIYQSGHIPFVRLMPRSGDKQYVKEKTFSLQKIIDGKFDAALTAWAEEAKAEDIPLLIDFAVEPNGDWFGWSGKYNGGGTKDQYGDPDYPDGPERYRDAYRHIVDIFRKTGVQKVTWFFHFNYDSSPNREWNQPYYYYPGDGYIDWIGFSLYGVQSNTDNIDGMDFAAQLYQNAQNMKQFSDSKPVALLEFGVSEHLKASKGEWFRQAFHTILDNPYVTFSAISVWHENWENEDGSQSDLRVDSSPKALEAFKKEIANERFVSTVRFQE